MKFWKTKPIFVRCLRISRSGSLVQHVAGPPVADELAVDGDLPRRAGVDLLQVVDGAQQGRLARTRRAQDDGDLALPDRQADAPQDVEGPKLLCTPSISISARPRP